MLFTTTPSTHQHYVAFGETQWRADTSLKRLITVMEKAQELFSVYMVHPRIDAVEATDGYDPYRIPQESLTKIATFKDVRSADMKHRSGFIRESTIPTPFRRLVVKFIPQAKQNGRVISGDPVDEAFFEVMDEEAIALTGADDLKALESRTEASGRLHHASTAPQWVKEWEGPYQCKIVDMIESSEGTS